MTKAYSKFRNFIYFLNSETFKRCGTCIHKALYLLKIWGSYGFLGPGSQQTGQREAGLVFRLKARNGTSAGSRLRSLFFDIRQIAHFPNPQFSQL